jgi:replication factor C subunit 3/5
MTDCKNDDNSIADSDKLAWVEKYRPGKWDEIKGNKDTILTIRKLVEGGGNNNAVALPHMLFYGPPGSGKTTAINVASKAMYGEAWAHMVLELNASNDRGIEVVRQNIIGFIKTANVLYKACGLAEPKHKYKLVILDEVDSMTSDAQATLRRLMEETSDNARFCLICNYQNKIDPAIQSRCVPFRFQPIDVKSVVIKLSEIAEKEGMKTDSVALGALCELSNGDMRKAINVLQILSLSKKKIAEVDIYRNFGIIDNVQIGKLFASLNMGKGGQSKGYAYLCDLVKTNGMDLKNIVTGIYRYQRTLEIDDIDRCRLLIDLSKLEICIGSSECDKIHIASMIGILADWKKNTN